MLRTEIIDSKMLRRSVYFNTITTALIVLFFFLVLFPFNFVYLFLLHGGKIIIDETDNGS